MHERYATRGESPLHNKGIECGDRYFGDCSSIDNRNSGRKAQKLVFVNHQLFGIGTSADDPHHFIAN